MDAFSLVPGDRNSMVTLPTRQAMTLSSTCYISSVRTTLCDIMCTVNASIPVNMIPPPDKLKPLSAKLPYGKNGQYNLKKKVKHSTLFQEMMMTENQHRVEKELRKDREDFFAQLRREKQDIDRKRNEAAVKIQALYRGFRMRRRPVEYTRRRKKRRVHSQNDMQDELCTLAAKLGLKPIDGLSLETRNKTSRRKERIMNAAAFRLHRFFAMILQRARARRRVEERKEEIIHYCARIITRCVRYVKVKKFVKKCENVKRQQMAIKMQCRIRIFHAREKVRVRAKQRHLRAKQEEAAIIIQRNLAPKNRANNLARLTMVTMRAYQKIADDVVNFVTDFLLEGGIGSVVDIFTTQISDKFEIVHPQVEERVFDNLINEAVVVEMHIWLEEQMLAMLEENQRISEERKRLEQELGLPEGSYDNINWESLPPEFFEAHPDLTDSAAGTRTHSPRLFDLVTNSNSPAPGGDPHSPEGKSASPSRKGPFEPRSRAGSLQPMLVAPSVQHRNRFLNVRGSLSGMAMGSFSLHGVSAPTASFSISQHQYSRALNRLSSVDMTHASKFEAALLAANLAAGSFSNPLSRQPSPLIQDGTGSRPRSSHSVRFVNTESPEASTNPAAVTSPLWPIAMSPLSPQGSSMGFGLILGQGIAEGDEEEDDETSSFKAPSVPDESPLHSPASPKKMAEYPTDTSDSAALDTTETSATVEADILVVHADDEPYETEETVEDTADNSLINTADATEGVETFTQAEETATQTETATQYDTTVADSADASQSEDLFRRSVTSDFAEAFASMSITSVLNAFGDSLVLGGDGSAEDEEESATIVQEITPEEAPITDNVAAEEPEQVTRGEVNETEQETLAEAEPEPQEEPEEEEQYSVASDIEENYYDHDKSIGASHDSADALADTARHVEEWEVCRNFTSVSLNESEKREIDQLFKDALYAFHKAKYQRASDILESFLPILQKFPSNDPFNPDVARVQTTIKTIKARILFETAQYADAKEVFDDALQHRIEVFGKAHYLCVELYYFIGEWHRAQAEYDIAEKYLSQASQTVAGLIKMQQDASSATTVDIKLWNAKNKVFVALAELYKQCGQYYKANLTIVHVQESLRQLESRDAESVRIQESFVCCWVSALTINGKYAQSVSLHQELLDRRRLRLGAVHPKIATSLCALGTLKLLRSEHAQAIEMIDESLAMRRRIYPQGHPAIAASLFAKGMAYARMGLYHEAAADMTHSLEMRRMKLGSTHPSVAQSASALAVIQTQMGDPIRAWKNHNFALEIFRSRYGVDKHRDIAQGLFNMACNAEMRGSYLEAVAYHEQALELKESIMQLFRGETMGAADLHLGVELSRMHVAHCYAVVSRLDEAKAMLKSAVKNITKILGNRSDHVAHSLCCLGELCKIRGNYADAKQLYALAFNITQELFGDDHPLIATTMLLSSENMRIPGMYPEAMELEGSAYDVRSYLFGGDNVLTALSVHQRAQLLRDVGRFAEAEKQYLRAMHILIARLGENNGLYGVVLGDFAECCRLTGKLDLAEKHFRHAIELQKASHGEASLQINETIHNFTLMLMDLHHPADAAHILKDKVVPTFEHLLGKDHPTTMYAKANLALSSQFVRFFVSQGTDEGSVILETVLGHPDIVTFMEACQVSSFAPDHPWLQRFSEGSQSFVTASSGTPPRTRTGTSGVDTGDNDSVQSSITGFQPTGSVSLQSGGDTHTEVQGLTDTQSQSQSQPTGSLVTKSSVADSADDRRSESFAEGRSQRLHEGTNTISNSDPYTPRDASLETRQTSQSAQQGMFSPTDNDSVSVHSYGDYSVYTPSEGASSLAGSIGYSNASSVSRSYVPYTQRTDYSSHAGNSLEGYDNDSQAYSQSQSQSPSHSGAHQQSSSYQSGTQPSSAHYSALHHRDSYTSQHSAVLEHYNDDDEYSQSATSASVTLSLAAGSVSPRSALRTRRNFSITPSSSTVLSKKLRNVEESSLGSWNDQNSPYTGEEGSLEEYYSQSQSLLEDESVGTLESSYRDKN